MLPIKKKNNKFIIKKYLEDIIGTMFNSPIDSGHAIPKVAGSSLRRIDIFFIIYYIKYLILLE